MRRFEFLQYGLIFIRYVVFYIAFLVGNDGLEIMVLFVLFETKGFIVAEGKPIM